MPSAAKVGALLVVFGLLLVAAYSVLGKSLFAPAAAVYYAEFPDAAGIRLGNPVLMAGVKIGEVKKVELANPRLARLTLDIDPKTQIPQGSTGIIPSSLVGIGESTITIEPPEGDATAPMAPGGTIQGRKAGPLDSILPNSKETVAELTKTMKAFRVLLEDQKLQGQVKTLMASTEKTIQEFGKLANRIDAVVAQNQNQIQVALVSVNRSLVDVNRITEQVAKLAEDPRFRNDAVAIMGQLKQTVTKVNQLVGDVTKTVNDPKLKGNLTATAENIQTLTETGKRIADNAERMTSSGVVIGEKAIGITEKVDRIASQAGNIADDIKSLTNRVSGILNPKPRPSPLMNLQVGMDLMHEEKPSYWRTDFVGELPFGAQKVTFGLYDAFESNKLTLQLGSSANNSFAYRYGIFAGRAGVGVDFPVAPRLALRGDLWSLNDPRLDLRARYDFGNGLLGWVGVDRALKDNALSFGVGIRR